MFYDDILCLSFFSSFCPLPTLTISQIHDKTAKTKIKRLRIFHDFFFLYLVESSLLRFDAIKLEKFRPVSFYLLSNFINKFAEKRDEIE